MLKTNKGDFIDYLYNISFDVLAREEKGHHHLQDCLGSQYRHVRTLDCQPSLQHLLSEQFHR